MCLSLSLYRRFLDHNTYHIGLSNRAMLDYSVSLIPCLLTQLIILTSKNQPVNSVHSDANVNILPLMFSIRQWKQLSYAVIHRWSAFTQTVSVRYLFVLVLFLYTIFWSIALMIITLLMFIIFPSEMRPIRNEICYFHSYN